MSLKRNRKTAKEKKKKREEAIAFRKKHPVHLHEGHQYVTRRDFLASGLIPFATSLVLPTVSGLSFSPKAFAQDCPPAGGTTNNHLLLNSATLNGRGGCPLAADFVPLDSGQNPVGGSVTTTLGQGTNPGTQTLGANGCLFFSSSVSSGFASGLVSTASAAALAKTVLIPVFQRTGDDTGQNELLWDSILSKVGEVGNKFSHLRNVNQTSTIAGQTVARLNYGNLQDLFNAASVGANSSLFSLGLNTPQIERVIASIKDLTAFQGTLPSSAPNAATANFNSRCATEANHTIVQEGPVGIDPRPEPVAAAWGIDTDSVGGERNVLDAAAIFNVLNGNAPHALFEVGGCDNHNGTDAGSRAAQDAKRAEVGERAGRIIESAHIMNLPLFLAVTTDGSMRHPNSNSNTIGWNTDGGTKGCMAIIAYYPNGAPAPARKAMGYFTSGGVASTSGNPLNQDERLAAWGIFLNLCSFANRMDLFAAAGGDAILNTTQQGQLLTLAPAT